MINSELIRRIQLGEDSTLELKQVLFAGFRVKAPHRQKLAEELTAFANGRGGTLVLGVDDKTREIVGIPLDKLDTVQIWVRDICKDLIEPSLDIFTQKFELLNSIGSVVAVICVEVERSLYVHSVSGVFFRRFGDTKRKLSAEGVARLYQERTQTRLLRFDEFTVPRTSLSDLDEGQTSRFLREGLTLNEVNVKKLGIAADDDVGVTRLTVAGVLLCTKSPQKWLPHAQIQAVHYKGERDDINYQYDAQDITGPLDEQVNETLYFAKRNMRTQATKQIQRTERSQYSERALFEALVNAVAHRDYSMAGSRIRFHMFRNRIELCVPGGIPNTLSPDSLHLRQYCRNESIVSFLARLPTSAKLGRSYMMDRRGDGVPIIRQETKKLTGKFPEYHLIDDSELQLIIPAAETDKF